MAHGTWPWLSERDRATTLCLLPRLAHSPSHENLDPPESQGFVPLAPFFEVEGPIQDAVRFFGFSTPTCPPAPHHSDCTLVFAITLVPSSAIIPLVGAFQGLSRLMLEG